MAPVRLTLPCLLLLAGCTGAPQANKPQACTVQRAATVPIQLDLGFLTVPATLEDKPVTMLVDTGAERTMLTPSAVQALRLDRDRHRHTTISGTGGALLVSMDATVQSFGFGGYEMSDQSYAVGPLSPRQTESGLIGADWLAQFDVEIDVPRRHLTLYQVEGCSGRYVPWHGPYADFQHVRPPGRMLITLPVRLEGQTLIAVLDSGANATEITEDAAARLGVTAAALAGDQAGHTIGVDQTRVTTHRHRFSDMEVGGERFPNVMLSVGAVHVPGADMLLGADFLRGRRVWLSYSTEQVFIQRPQPAG